MPGKMAYLTYTANDGTPYSIKTRARYLGALNQTVGGTVALGFGALTTPAAPPLPKGMKVRTVHLQDPTGGSTRTVPCGSLTAPAWTGEVSTVQCDYSGIGTMTDFTITGKSEETPAQFPHPIYNASDAS